MKKLFYILFLSVGIFFSCTTKTDKTKKSEAVSTLNLSYAEGFGINYYTNYTEAIVYSPWVKGEIYARYYLVKDASITTPTNGRKIQIPLKTLAATFVTQFEFLSLLGELEKINGVCY